MAQVAARLKQSQEAEFQSAVKVIGDTLEVKGWEAFKRTIERLAYSYDWDAGLLNPDVTAHPWDEAAENDEQKQDRKTFFCFSAGPLIYIRIYSTPCQSAALK